MKGIREPIWAILLLAGMVGCTGGGLSPHDYIEWLEDTSNPLNQVKTVGDYVFSLQYTPAAYIVLKKSRQEVWSEALLEGLDKDKLQYCTLHIGVVAQGGKFLEWGLTSNEEYRQRLDYYSFGMQGDVYIEQIGQKYPCQSFLYEQGNDMKGEAVFVLGFEKTTSNAPFSIVLQPKYLKTGPIKFNIDTSTIPLIQW